MRGLSAAAGVLAGAGMVISIGWVVCVVQLVDTLGPQVTAVLLHW